MIAAILLAAGVVAPVSAEKLSHPPIALRPATPTALAYPPRAFDRGVEGETFYTLSVDAAGRVTGCTVTKSSGSADLDRASCAAARRMRFEPAADATGRPIAGKWASSLNWVMQRR